MARVEDPDLLVHDAAAAVPLAHINRVNRYAVRKLLAQRVGFLFLAGKARALENADGHAAGGGIAQSLVERAAGAGAHRLELRVRKALLVVARRDRAEAPSTSPSGRWWIGRRGSGERARPRCTARRACRADPPDPSESIRRDMRGRPRERVHSWRPPSAVSTGRPLVLRLVCGKHSHEELGPATHARAKEIVLLGITLSLVAFPLDTTPHILRGPAGRIGRQVDSSS